LLCVRLSNDSFDFSYKEAAATAIYTLSLHERSSDLRKNRRPGKSNRANAYAAGRQITAETAIVVNANASDSWIEENSRGSANTSPNQCSVHPSGSRCG